MIGRVETGMETSAAYDQNFGIYEEQKNKNNNSVIIPPIKRPMNLNEDDIINFDQTELHNESLETLMRKKSQSQKYRNQKQQIINNTHQAQINSKIESGVGEIEKISDNDQAHQTYEKRPTYVLSPQKKDNSTQMTTSFYYNQKLLKRKLKEPQFNDVNNQKSALNTRIQNNLGQNNVQEQREKSFNQNQMLTDQQQLPNNTFQKLFSPEIKQTKHNRNQSQNTQQMDNFEIHGTSELKMPPIATMQQSPQQIVKKTSTISSNDYKYQSHQQNTNQKNQMNDSFYESLKNKELFTPISNNFHLKNPSLITENKELKQALNTLKQKVPQRAEQQRKLDTISSIKQGNTSNNQTSTKQISEFSTSPVRPKQQLIMNTFLTPIMFVSKDFHLNEDYNLDINMQNLQNPQAMFGLNSPGYIYKALQNGGQQNGFFPPLYNNNNSPNQSYNNMQIQDQESNNFYGKKRLSRSDNRQGGGKFNTQKNHSNYQISPRDRNNIQETDGYRTEGTDEYNGNEMMTTQNAFNITANNFYESIRVEMPDDFTLLDNEIKVLCKKLEFYIQTRNPRIDLTMNTLRLKHPVFKMISTGAFNYLIEKSFLFNLKNNQGAYKEGLKAQKNIYFVLYGAFKLEKAKTGIFGEQLKCGFTAGEEIIFITDDVIHRMESCLSVNGEAALLQVNVEDLIKMSTIKHTKGGGTSMVKDFQTLMGILFYNYEQKQEWRKQVDANQGEE